MMPTSLHEKMAFCMQCGEFLLKNGASTIRVTNAMQRVGRALGLADINVLVIPTGIFATVEEDGKTVTKILRLPVRAMDLSCIVKLEDVLSQFCEGSLSWQEAQQRLKEVERDKAGFSAMQVIAATGVVGAAYAYLTDSNGVNLIPTFLTSSLVCYVMLFLAMRGVSRIVYQFSSGALAALCGIILPIIFPFISRDTVIVGAIIPLVPGTTIISAMRDMVDGELLSAVMLALEALVASVAVAVGVAIVLSGGMIWGVLS